MHASNLRPAPVRGLATCVAATLATLLAAAPAFAVPLPQKVSGTLSHGGTVTITGSGFGTKATAAPLVWDDASGTSMTDKWSGAWPNALPGYNIGYYAPMRGIGLPHSHDTRYIAGAHAADTGANSGYDVMMYKAIKLPAFPYYIYVSWYQRADNQWTFGGDNNFKIFDYSEGTEPYAVANNWYICYGPPHPSSNTDNGLQWTDSPPLANPDNNGHNSWWGKAVNPMAGQWSKVEMTIKVSNKSDGYMNIWENGQLVMNYSGITDMYGGTDRSIAVGGYARMQGYTTNWRYYDDVYLDTTLSRVVLADKPVLSQATIVENQIPSAWSDGSITAKVNLGKFTSGQPAYLFVVDSAGNVSAAGVAVTAGGTASTTAPNPPSQFVVQ